MSNVFRAQTLFTLKLDCVTDISTASVLKILYTKPNGITGDWIAVRDGATNVIKKDMANGEIDIAGEWQFQSYVVIGGYAGFGDIVRYKFYEPIKVP
jgi:hypothetical protein